MFNLYSRILTLRKKSEDAFSLGEIIISISIMLLLMVMVTNIEITTFNAQVTLTTKLDVSTNARIIASVLEFRDDPTVIPINIHSQGCDGGPVLMQQFPISVIHTTCLTITGDSTHYVVVGTAHDTNREVTFTFDSLPIYLHPAPEVVSTTPANTHIVAVPTVALTHAQNGNVTESVTFVDGTTSVTIVFPDGSYTTTETTKFGTIKTKKGQNFVFGQNMKL